jgi:UPF0176 protein
MKAIKSQLLVYSFYRFKRIDNKKKIKEKLEKNIKEYFIKGTILLANEGLNGSISGEKKEVVEVIRIVKKTLKIKKLEFKINVVDKIPFNRMKIRLKNEIVSLGKGKIDVNKERGILINPKNWKKLIQDKNIKLIDTRNEYEIAIGSFKNSINPKTNSFREFPNKFEKLNIKKKEKIAMYCTGGIRCEKASAYLKNRGYKYVYQLEGGILKYLEYEKSKKNGSSHWKGDCFVFDNRVTVTKNLNTGSYKQCFGCRRPLNKRNLKSILYEKGVSCEYCYNNRTENQIKRSRERQSQINNLNFKKLNHNFMSITVSKLNKLKNIK